MGVRLTSYIEPPRDNQEQRRNHHTGKPNKSNILTDISTERPHHHNHNHRHHRRHHPRVSFQENTLLAMIRDDDDEDIELTQDTQDTDIYTSDSYDNETTSSDTNAGSDSDSSIEPTSFMVPYPPHRRLRRRERDLSLDKSNRFKHFITYGCRHCRTHLSSSWQVVSKEYRGRTGDAYLFDGVCNVLEDTLETRSMVTGQYMICNIVCRLCKTALGWRYIRSERREQKYKEGMYILEVKNMCRCN